MSAATELTQKEMAVVLKSAFDPYYPASLEPWMEFAAYCTHIQIQKDTVLKSAGTTEQYMYFIVKGCAGVFLWKENNDVCTDIGFEGHFFTDYMSLLTGAPSPLETRTLEPCDLLRLSRADYLTLGNTQMGMILTRAAAESSFIEKQQQQIALLTQTAEQRYRNLLQTHPEIVSRVAQKHIASYLGITPQSISRIRRKLAQ